MPEQRKSKSAPAQEEEDDLSIPEPSREHSEHIAEMAEWVNNSFQPDCVIGGPQPKGGSKTRVG